MTVGPTAARRKASRRRRLRYYRWVLLFMSPWLLGFFMFTAYPMLASLYYSFTHYNQLSPPQWVGLSNYRFMVGDPNFWLSLRNTVWIIAVGTPISIVFAIVTAMVLIRPRRGRTIYRAIYFVPTMVPTVATALAFAFLLNPKGPIDMILGLLHAPQPLWFQDPLWSKPGLVILGLWGVGETMIIFLASMLDVPAQLYEAAELEGVGPWQRFRYITLPMISPVVFFSAVMGVIYGFQYFTEAYVIGTAAGGPGAAGYPQNSTLFYGIWLYQQAFNYYHYGYATALAWVLFLIIMVFTLVLIRTSRHWVYYQGGFR